MSGAAWGVIFDLDGTMVNNSAFHRRAWVELCRQRGFELTDAMYYQKIHARSNDKIAANLFGDSSPEFVRRLEEQKEGLYQRLFRPHLAEIPGLTALLEDLRRRGVPCAAASNSPKTNVDFVLDGLNLRRFFDVALDRGQVTVGKPDPQIFLKCCDALGLSPNWCAVFEDSASGFAAARAAGMPYVAITCGTDPSELDQARDAQLQRPDFVGLNAQTVYDILCAFNRKTVASAPNARGVSEPASR